MLKIKIMPREKSTEVAVRLQKLHAELNCHRAFVNKHLRHGRLVYCLIDGQATVIIKSARELPEEIRRVIEINGFTIVPPEDH